MFRDALVPCAERRIIYLTILIRGEKITIEKELVELAKKYLSDEELSNLLKKAIIQELDIYGGSMSKLFDFVQMKKYNKI